MKKVLVEGEWLDFLRLRIIFLQNMKKQIEERMKCQNTGKPGWLPTFFEAHFQNNCLINTHLKSRVNH